MPNLIQTEKVCTKCKQPGEFVRNKNTPDGFHRWCKKCLSEGKKKSYLKKKSIYNEKSRNNYLENKELYNRLNKEWRDNNKDKMSLYIKKYRSTEKGRKTRLKITREKRAWVKIATPPWVNKKELRDFYKKCPKGLTVDHIIPYKGENVCGLNVPWNLQYLTPLENSLKSNKQESEAEIKSSAINKRK